MKILAIYPGLNPVFDEVAHTLPALVRNGCAVKVLTTKMSAMKSAEQAADYEGFRGVGIHRIYANALELQANPSHLRAVSGRLADDFKPDLVFLNSLHSLPLGRSMARRSEAAPHRRSLSQCQAIGPSLATCECGQALLQHQRVTMRRHCRQPNPLACRAHICFRLSPQP